ncbi:MAG: flagellar hook assembly protein FlgD [Lysobacter sp.]|nr:flagellar hook assembly protein FlgD [Lysobacter sp.]
MTTINGTAGTTGNPYAGYGLDASAGTKKKALGQADFLHLMTEQLKNQDPLKPLDNAQFLGQLAQFSTVQGIEQMNSAMGAMASVMENDQALRAATLVGHEALVDASSLALASGKGVNGEIVATSAGPMRVEVVDGSGQVVRRMSVDAPAAGNVAFRWDGRDDGGNAAPAGTYTVRASAGSGQDAQALAVRVAAHIDSVSIEASGLVLNLAGLGSVPLSTVRRIG